ncbi:MAG TPA: hypothetical protein VIL26_06725 [Clostridia bacterium]
MFKKTIGKPLEKVLDVIGEVLAFLVILLLAFSFINTAFGLTDNEILLKVIAITKTYAIIGVVAIVGLEFVIDKGLILTLIYLALVAVVVIFSFFPEVQAQIMNQFAKLALKA